MTCRPRDLARAWASTALALACGAALSSCIYYPALPDYSKKNDEEPLGDVEPERVTRNTRWADGSPRAEYDLLLWPDGRQLRHGSFLEAWPDGTLRADRTYAEGVPIGTWRSWYVDGGLRSEESFPGGGGEGHARWWHENGELAAEGPTEDGVRQGRWRFWDEAGVELEAVHYESGVAAAHAKPSS